MNKIHKLSSVIRGFALGAAVLASAPLANAAGEYFTTATATGGTYSWDAANWSTSGTGPYNSHYVPGSLPEFRGPGNYTVTCSATESMAGIYQDASGILTITNLGTGGLSIVANNPVTTQNGFSWLTQGFYIASGATLSLTAPIGGAGGVQQEYVNGIATLQLYGTNTYTGGTLITSSSIIVDFNNNSSFGALSSQIGFNGTGFAVMNNTGSASVTIPNAVQTIGTCAVNFIGNSSTFSGNWYLGGAAYIVSLRNNGAAGSVVTLSGVLSATSGNVIYSGANGGSILLSGNNTYTGPTLVGSPGDANITLEIASTGSISGSVSNIATLKLDGATCLSTNASLQLAASPAVGAVNLNFTGTQSIAGLYLGGVVQAGGTYGSTSSGATYQLAAFTGNGVLSIPAAPNIVQQPASEAALNSGSATFSVTAVSSIPLAYQWYFGSSAIWGANSSSYTISPVSSNNIGSYDVVITNTAGSVTSSVVSLSLVESNCYTQAIVGDGAIAYYRLDETSGTVAHDVINGYNGTYTNVSLDQPGFSLLDTDPGIGLPASTSSRGYVNVPLPANGAFNFLSTEPFTLEGWAYFTNLTGVQRLFSTLGINGGNGNGYAFGINGNNDLRFTQGGVQDADLTLTGANILVTGVWYYLAVTCDGSDYYYYINGNQVGTVTVGGVGVPQNGVGNPATSPMALGADPVQYPFTAEQVHGNLDEMAIYATTLNGTQIMNHYNASYCGSLRSWPVFPPIAYPPTNYAGLSSTLQAVAAGQALSYQWYQSPSTLLSGQTNSTLTISPLVSTASYYVNVSNPVENTNSPIVTVTVLPIPTNAAMLNLTNALVLHLPFDGDYGDISGRSNNGTNVGATTFVSPGAVGSSALSYSSSTSPASFNYVILGVRPDLQFSSNIDFSVSFWVQQPAGSTFTNLPFFTDAIGSTGNGGFAFAPYATSGASGGGWIWTVGSVTSPSQYTTFSDVNLINDGNWHHLVFVADRSANLSTYLDGVQVDSQSISFVGNINTGNAATIGQDPTGAYPVTASAYIDDIGVWQRTLSPLEVTGIYLAGVINGVSFAPCLVPTRVYEPLTVQVVAGQVQLSWGGTANLQGSANASGTYTNIPGATSPYTVTSPSTQMFYRLHP